MQFSYLPDLSITTDLNLLVVIPRIYQMMRLLEWNAGSEEQGKGRCVTQHKIVNIGVSVVTVKCG